MGTAPSVSSVPLAGVLRVKIFCFILTYVRNVLQ